MTSLGSQTYSGQVILDAHVVLTAGGDLSLTGGLSGGANTLTLTGSSGGNHYFTLGGAVNFQTGFFGNVIINGDSAASSTNTLSVNTNDPAFTWTVSGTLSGNGAFQ